DEDTMVVSIQAANNEIGTIQPIKKLAALAHATGAYFHTDAAQAVGKISVDVLEWEVDLLSISAHKIYGPKGVGALFVRGGAYSMPISPLVYGGEQEYNLRSGTLNAPGIVGFGKACELCSQELESEMERLSSLRDFLESQLIKQLEVQRNGSLNNRLPNNCSFTFRGIDAEALIVNMPELAISTGSACTSGALEPSSVLQAIGLSREDADSTIRIGIGRLTTEDEIVTASKLIVATLKKLKEY
nr:cysteine desulfurase [Chloroflexota bacterium]